MSDDFEKKVEGIFGYALDRPFTSGVIVIALLVALSIAGNLLGMFSWGVQETTQVIKEEFGPKEILRKYEWFKDAAASLDKKQADIVVYEKRLNDMHKNYGDMPYGQWDRTDKEAMQQWQAEVAGVTASYNQLASEYNSNMAKFNWRFTETGKLPQGATEALPREFKPYR